MLLESAVSGFLVSLEANGRAFRTIGSYRQRLGGFQEFLKARGVVVLEAVGPADLDAWAVSMRRQRERYEAHFRRPREPGGLSDVTISGRIQAVRAFFQWCVDRAMLERSPARHLRRPRVRHSARSKVMQVEDLQLIHAEAVRRAEAGQPRDLALVCFVADTGCRRGEVAALCVRDLDLVSCEALVHGKTGQGWVDFSERTAEALRAWLKVRPTVDHDLVFVNLSNRRDLRGGPLSVDGVYQAFKRLAAAAGVAGRFNPHALRHLVGQRFTDEANLELARQKLRHRSITTTAEFYANQDRGRVKRATVRLSLVNGEDD